MLVKTIFVWLLFYLIILGIMSIILSVKKLYIKICRYIFKQKYLSIMEGKLKGYKWPTDRNYEYILGTNEEKNVLNEFCSWFTPSSIFYDLGSNIGYYSLIANTIISSGKIYAIEPTAFNNKIFRALLILNKKYLKTNCIQIKEFAIADIEKDIMFSNNTKFSESNSYINNTFNNNAATFKVKCYSIDSLLSMGYEAPNIIKIDIEGAEYDALRGAKNTLIKYKPNLLLATHNCVLPRVKENCIHFLEDLGYQLKHTGYHNKTLEGLDDYIAVHKENKLINNLLQKQ
jgi:FkbM family methyltransferase